MEYRDENFNISIDMYVYAWDNSIRYLGYQYPILYKCVSQRDKFGFGWTYRIADPFTYRKKCIIYFRISHLQPIDVKITKTALNCSSTVEDSTLIYMSVCNWKLSGKTNKNGLIFEIEEFSNESNNH